MLNIPQIGLINPVINRVIFDDDYQAWLDAITTNGDTLPLDNIQLAQNQLVLDLKTDGLWTRMKTGYLLHSGSAGAGRVNLKNPATYQSTLVNSPSFSEGNGIRSNGTSSYINQPFKSDEYAGIESDLTAVTYVSESSTDQTLMLLFGMNTRSSSGVFGIIPNWTSGDAFYHYQGSGSSFTNTDHRGLYVLTHDGTQSVIYKDGTKTAATVTPVAPNISINRLILARNNHTSSGGVTPIQFYNKYVAYDFLFDRFSDTDESTLRGILDTYKTSTGLP